MDFVLSSVMKALDFAKKHKKEIASVAMYVGEKMFTDAVQKKQIEGFVHKELEDMKVKEKVQAQIQTK